MLPEFLARAEMVDPTVSSLSIVLICASIVALAAVAAMVPALVARSRRSRHFEIIMTCAVLWALSASLSAGAAVLRQMKYSHEHLLQIQSGYYDPEDTADAPASPWPTWIALSVVYTALLAWPLAQSRRTSPTG